MNNKLLAGGVVTLIAIVLATIMILNPSQKNEKKTIPAVVSPESTVNQKVPEKTETPVLIVKQEEKIIDKTQEIKSVEKKSVVVFDNIDLAKAEALKSKKSILLLFFTDKCDFCDKLEQEIIVNRENLEKVASKYVVLKVERSKNRPLTRNFSVNSYPYTIIMDPDMNILNRFPGYRSLIEYFGKIGF